MILDKLRIAQTINREPNDKPYAFEMYTKEGDEIKATFGRTEARFDEHSKVYEFHADEKLFLSKKRTRSDLAS